MNDPNRLTITFLLLFILALITGSLLTLIIINEDYKNETVTRIIDAQLWISATIYIILIKINYKYWLK